MSFVTLILPRYGNNDNVIFVVFNISWLNDDVTTRQVVICCGLQSSEMGNKTPENCDLLHFLTCWNGSLTFAHFSAAMLSPRKRVGFLSITTPLKAFTRSAENGIQIHSWVSRHKALAFAVAQFAAKGSKNHRTKSLATHYRFTATCGRRKSYMQF